MQKVRQIRDEWQAPLISRKRADWPTCRQGKGPVGPCFIVGTWDDFEGFHEMTWNATSEHYHLKVQMTDEEESFQILVGSESWGSRIYPSRQDANPFDNHFVKGPNSGGHGMNWTMGRDPRECAGPGVFFRIVLECCEGKFRVDWSCLADNISKQSIVDCQKAAETAWVAESNEVVSDDVKEDELPAFVFSGPPIDVPSTTVEKLLGPERKVQVAHVQQVLQDYEDDPMYPRDEDASFINREGYEVFLLTDAVSQVRNKFQRPEATRLRCTHPDSQPIVIVAFMAVHITNEARLQKLRRTLLSIQQQQVLQHEAEFVVGISWYASTPEFCRSCNSLFTNFRTARRRSNAGKRRSSSSSYETFCKLKDVFEAAPPQEDAPVTVVVQQQQRHTQFQHIRAALDAVEDELRRLWCFKPGSEEERSIWCMFGDDDDIWHPRRVVEFANAMRRHELLAGVAAFASAARAEVAPAAQTGKHVVDEELPKTVTEVDAFLNTKWGLRRNKHPDCMAWMEHYNKQANAVAATLWTPGEVIIEYFDFCLRLRLLHEFFEVTSPQVIAHRFCDLRLDMFLITYPFMGREMGLELVWFDPGDVWMYFYANAGIDHETIVDDVENGADGEGFITAKALGSGEEMHVSTSFPIRQADKLLAEQVYEQLKPFDDSLTLGRLTKYLAAYRISLEVSFIRIHTRRVDQRTFDQLVFDAVMASFGSFGCKIWRHTPDLSSRAATRLFKVCQSYAKQIAKRFDISILWHFPDDYIMPDPVQQAEKIEKQYLASLGNDVEDVEIDADALASQEYEDTLSTKVTKTDVLSSDICTTPSNVDPVELS